MSLTRIEVVFRLLDGRRVSVGRVNDEGYLVKVMETVGKKKVCAYKTFVQEPNYDKKITTYRKIMESALEKTLYVVRGAEDVCVRSLE